MNNKGFALSAVIYGILIVFLVLIFSILSVLVIRGNTLSKIKENAYKNINNESDSSVAMPVIIADFASINITSDASDYVTLDYNINVLSPYNYEITNNVEGNIITYKAFDGSEEKASITRNINLNASPLEQTYEYKKDFEKVLLNPGLYKLETWGAKGSSNGNHTAGYLYLDTKKIVYIYVGGKGTHGYNSNISHISYREGLFNGDAIISSASIPELLDASIEEGTSTTGRVKITSLIYFTK